MWCYKVKGFLVVLRGFYDVVDRKELRVVREQGRLHEFAREIANAISLQPYRWSVDVIPNETGLRIFSLMPRVSVYNVLDSIDHQSV